MIMDNKKILANNKKAYHDYFIDETFEAGISLSGTEVKSVRMGKVNLKDSYAYIKNGEVLLSNTHISPYEQGNIFNLDPLRDRKLLLNKQEINKITGWLTQKGYTLVALSIYLKGKWVKVQLGLARGKKLYDKRDDIAERDAKRQIEQRLKEQSKY
ncbi:MAG: SsrA-binding protein SmpB [Deltaproteobacteria bacterium]